MGLLLTQPMHVGPLYMPELIENLLVTLNSSSVGFCLSGLDGSKKVTTCHLMKNY